MEIETQPMKSEELGQFMCVAPDGCKHVRRSIVADGVWVRSTGQDPLNPGSSTYSSAHRECVESAT